MRVNAEIQTDRISPPWHDDFMTYLSSAPSLFCDSVLFCDSTLILTLTQISAVISYLGILKQVSVWRGKISKYWATIISSLILLEAAMYFSADISTSTYIRKLIIIPYLFIPVYTFKGVSWDCSIMCRRYNVMQYHVIVVSCDCIIMWLVYHVTAVSRECTVTWLQYHVIFTCITWFQNLFQPKLLKLVNCTPFITTWRNVFGSKTTIRIVIWCINFENR